MDEETRRYAKIIKAKQDRLHYLDIQAATYGVDVAPQIEMERSSLQEELSMMEIALQSPARASVGEELGPRGRFVVNLEQNREIKQSIAALSVELARFVADSLEKWAVNRLWAIVISMLVVVLLVVVVVFVTYTLTIGGL